MNKSNIIMSILGSIIGDCVGVPYEFKNRNMELTNDEIFRCDGYGTHNQPGWTWSDDTSMILATMVGLDYSRNTSVYEDMYCISKEFSRWRNTGEYTKDGLFDIGGATRRAIDDMSFLNKCGSKNIIDFLNRNENPTSLGNGSLMRILPAILYYYNANLSENEKIYNVLTIGNITHNNDTCNYAIKFYYNFIKSIIEGETKYNAFNKATDSVNEIAIDYTKSINKILSDGHILHTLESVIYCFMNCDSFDDCVGMAVRLGGDTDTIASLVGGLCGLYGYKFDNHIKTFKNNTIDLKYAYIVNIIDNFIEKIGVL